MIRQRKKESVNTEKEVIEEKSIIKAVEFPERTFETKAELFKHLKENEVDIISVKTSAIKDSENCSFKLDTTNDDTIKQIKGLEEGKIAAVINTTNFIDSHNDVHLPKIWNQSLKEQKGKVYYITDHDLKVDSVIAFPKDVEMSAQTLTWKELGQDFTGNTDALIFIVVIDKIKNAGALEIIEEKIDIEHSVRMQYVKIFLAIDSEAKEDKDYKKRFDKYINQIANKQVAIDRGYFWGVSEAKIIKEGSMVLFGSNEVTPLIHSNSESAKVAHEDESAKVAHEDESLEDAQKEEGKRRRRILI